MAVPGTFSPFVGSRDVCFALLKCLAGVWRDEFPVRGILQTYTITVDAAGDVANVLTERADGSMKRGLQLVRVARLTGNVHVLMWGDKFCLEAPSPNEAVKWLPIHPDQCREWPWVKSRKMPIASSAASYSSSSPSLTEAYGFRQASAPRAAGAFRGWKKQKGATTRIPWEGGLVSAKIS